VLHLLATPIAEAEGEACIEGVVRSTGAPPLVSPVTRRRCIGWQVHGSLIERERGATGAQDFYVEDDSGTALVITEHASLSLGAVERGGALDLLDVDIRKLEGTITDLRAAARAGKARHDEVRPLRQLATVLYAVRAQARGLVHAGNSLEGQQRFIEERSAEVAATMASHGMAARYLQSSDAVLCDGDRVRVAGLVRREVDPEGLVGGYREQATRVVVRAPEGDVVHITAEVALETAEGTWELVAPDSEDGDESDAVAPPQPTQMAWRAWPLWILLFAAAAIGAYARSCLR
jgi:hypothetical protein